MAAAAAAAAAAGGGGGGAAVAGGGSAVALLQPATGTAAGSQIKILEQTKTRAHQGPERGPRTRPARDRSGQGPIISATAEATCPTIGRDKGEAHHLPRPNLAGRGQTVASSHAMRGDKNAAAIGPGPADKEGTWLNRVLSRRSSLRQGGAKFVTIPEADKEAERRIWRSRWFARRNGGPIGQIWRMIRPIGFPPALRKLPEDLQKRGKPAAAASAAAQV
ncbi:hypothetical protein AXG93_1333s1180 [Marchantia polymorpha subsp. ruderalis]|uniref:Uncharacterized protein n=1 Tax=Marchantia polymorpha subsp. ruderalis TaxID=1480154 RepID=A0A176WRL7_MARPO|nr:hypothetical protein AXG93_1333s1180 [Marchantia polymorpha subsp. ruderalis]